MKSQQTKHHGLYHWAYDFGARFRRSENSWASRGWRWSGMSVRSPPSNYSISFCSRTSCSVAWFSVLLCFPASFAREKWRRRPVSTCGLIARCATWYPPCHVSGPIVSGLGEVTGRQTINSSSNAHLSQSFAVIQLKRPRNRLVSFQLQCCLHGLLNILTSTHWHSITCNRVHAIFPWPIIEF